MNVNVGLLKNINTLGVAVSGGADSMALLHWAVQNGERLGFCPVAINVNHNFREERESAADSAFVAQYCKARGIKLCSRVVSPGVYGSSGNKEAKARQERYAFFEELVSEGAVDAVATAHHASDNAETVLLHLFRGSGLKGVSGIAPKNGNIIRPLLDVSREEIEAYLKENNIPFVTDGTNADNTYRRNYLRNTVMPLIQKEFPAAVKNICAFAAHAAEEEAFLQSLSPQAYAEADGSYFVPLENFMEMGEDPIMRRAVRSVFAKIDGLQDYSRINADVVCALKSKQVGTTADVKHGIKAEREYGGIRIFLADSGRGDPGKVEKYSAKLPQTIFLGGFCVRLTRSETDQIPKKPALVFDPSKVPAGSCWRTRREGDTFAAFGGGTLPLKEFLIDKKVPRRVRDFLPLLCYNNTVLLIAGIELSKGLAVSEATKTVAGVDTVDLRFEK